MLHRLMHLALVGAALLFFADSSDARGRKGSCGGGGRHASHCGGGGCGGGYVGGCATCGVVGGAPGIVCGPGGCGVPVLGGIAPGVGHGGQGGHGGKDKKGKGKGGEDDTAAPAGLVVTLPQDARLLVDGQQTESTSGRRVFTTPPLQSGRDYHYTLRAEVVRDGQTQHVTQQVRVRAGEYTQVNLEIPATTVASR